MSEQDNILNFLRLVGPTIPSKVAKHIGTQILIASAHLSDLSAQGKVKISSLKIGGTPLYYLPGQEAHLYTFAAGNLNPKDFQVLQKLKDQKILREKELDLLSKVALRGLKDFAIPLHVTVYGNTELFWKWHTSTNEETNAKIGEILQILSPPIVKLPQEAVLPEIQLPEVKHEIPPQQKTLMEAAMPQPSQKEAIAPQEEISEEMSERISKQLGEQLFQEAEETEKEEETEEEIPPRLSQKIIERTEERKHPKTKEKSAKKRNTITEDFSPQLEEFLSKLRINIEQKEVLRKNSEINCIVKVPSVVGKITYFCKAKNKARCDEKDLSSAYMEAQIKKLPLLFVYSEELHKKAQDMLDTGAFENVVVKRMS